MFVSGAGAILPRTSRLLLFMTVHLSAIVGQQCEYRRVIIISGGPSNAEYRRQYQYREAEAVNSRVVFTGHRFRSEHGGEIIGSVSFGLDDENIGVDSGRDEIARSSGYLNFSAEIRKPRRFRYRTGVLASHLIAIFQRNRQASSRILASRYSRQ